MSLCLFQPNDLYIKTFDFVMYNYAFKYMHFNCDHNSHC